MNNSTILLIVIILLFLLSFYIVDNRKAKKKLQVRLLQSWGKKPEANYKAGDLESIASFFTNYKSIHPNIVHIDDITWHDLEMDNLFMRINNSETTVGEETLYRLLREQCFDLNKLYSRRILIEFFQNNPGERLAIQSIMAKLGKMRLINPTDYLFQAASLQHWRIWTYKFLAGIALASPLILFINVGFGVLLIVLSAITNMLVYYNRRSEIGPELSGLNYIVRFVRSIGALTHGHMAASELSELGSMMRRQYESLKHIGDRGLFIVFQNAGALLDPIIEWIRIVVLKELIDYEHLHNQFTKHRKELIEAYETFGLLDSLIAIASFRESVLTTAIHN